MCWQEVPEAWKYFHYHLCVSLRQELSRGRNALVQEFAFPTLVAARVLVPGSYNLVPLNIQLIRLTPLPYFQAYQATI